jgi:2-hydroxychromene-2-carboxylate isomerase
LRGLIGDMDDEIYPRPVAELDFWFEFGSQYSYLSVMRIDEAAARHGVAVRWQPFLLGPIFKSLGWSTSPFVLQKAKGDYTWRDMARQCDKYGLAWERPSVFPRSAVLPLRVALVGASQPWMADYCRRMMQMNFVQDRDIDGPGPVREVLQALGLAPEPILAQAVSEPVKTALRAQTERAQALGIFGAPTFFVEGEMFWGNDRLDDALAFASRGR